jgi:ATP-binding cassette subfamily B protein
VTTLQNLTFTAMVNVAGGDEPALLRRIGLTTPRSQIQALAAVAALLTGPAHWTNYVRRRAWKKWSQDTEHRLRALAFKHLEEQDIEFFDSHGTGQLMALLTSDVASIGALIDQLDGVVESSLTIALAGTSLMRNSPRLALVAGAAVPLMLVPMRVLKGKTQATFSSRANLTSQLNQALENILSGIVEVKSFTAEEVENERVSNLGKVLAEVSVAANSLPVAQTTAAGNIYYAGYVPALTFSALRVLFGEMEEDQLARATFWFPRLVSALGRFQDAGSAYYAATAAAQRLVGVLEAKPRIRDGTIPLDAARVHGDISVENVTLGYDPSRPVLRDISISLPAGQTLGIVGPSGSGKTTLLKLLLRFYEANRGRVLLDGLDIKDLRIRDLRSAIAMLSQDVYLFNGTVRHNVLYGRSSATDEEVIAALAAAGAQDLLDSLPQGLSTDVGEHGSRLSGGQRQRVALARALLKNAPVFALDEPTSHLDYATEAAVKVSLKNATAGKTMLLVAHRLTNVRDADNIVVLDGGVIREQGRHEELLEQRGLYYSLWQLQS